MPRTIYPLAMMRVGDSFSAPISKLQSLRHLVTNHYKKALPDCKFLIVPNGTALRCWKIADDRYAPALSFAIFRDIPIPPRISGNSIFPLRFMEIGDSFVLRGEERSHLKKLYELCSRYKRLGVGQYKIRKIDNETARCWRIA